MAKVYPIEAQDIVPYDVVRWKYAVQYREDICHSWPLYSLVPLGRRWIHNRFNLYQAHQLRGSLLESLCARVPAALLRDWNIGSVPGDL
ncbi:hypothetical protein AVEN_29578-1 [Araneus ventricosus]|uniref:Uncharacterized protein n=1 Tax=Araneus ventricosus TaxID=182803 RepID=A0A4Y2SZF9_ARAVE|nr:hypothetical protein AVEN_29578-1 [Araneus ventricosus]